MQGFNHLNTMFVNDPALAEMYERGMADPASLGPDERRRYVWLTRCYVNIYENLYQQFLRGACPESYWVRYARELKQSLDTPGGRIFREGNTTYGDLYGYLDAMPDVEVPAYEFGLARREGG